jgi:tetratricopeptide (TPR) repeat protein
LKPRQFIPVLILVAGIWAYHNSLRAPFIYDDAFSITRNPHIRRLWPIWDALSPTTKSFVGGRPIVNLSLALNYALGGLAVRGYHVFNLAIHLLAGLTLYGIVRRTFLRQECWSTGVMECWARFGTSGEWVALTVAVLWTVHPLQTEAVTYISQRCESLMGLFYLLTLYCFVRGVESPGWPRGSAALRMSYGVIRGMGSKGSETTEIPRQARDDKPQGTWFLLSVAACFLGMASKEVMVTAPAMVLLYDRTFVSGSFREAWSRHWRLYLGLASSWLLLGYLMPGLRNRNVGYGLGIPWWGYALAECRAVVQYLGLALWPHPLIFDYGAYEPTRHLAAVAPYALILAVLAAGVLVALKWQPAIGFLGAWFFVILAPTSSVVPIVGSPMAEHRMYLPLAAVMAALVLGTFGIGRRLLSERQSVMVACVAGGAVLVLFTSMTIERNQVYNSELAIWQDTVKKLPNRPRAHEILGEVLVQLGRLPEAIRQYEQALQINPEYTEAHNNLGTALEKSGHTQEAIQHYKQVLRIKPDFAQAQYNWGVALQGAGQVQQATSHYEQALQAQPDFAEAHNNLGVVLMGLGRLEEAVRHYEQALRINPEYAEAQNNLALALLQLGRLTEAIEHWEQALRIKPDYAGAHYKLGLALEKTGRVQEAIGHYEQVVRLQPDFADAGNSLAWLLATHPPAQGGNAVRAVALAQRACELTGNSRAGYLDTLAAAYAAAGQFREAIATAEKAIALARTGGQPKLATECEARLELYRSGRAYFQPVSEADK